MGRRYEHTPDELRKLIVEAAEGIISEGGLKALKVREVVSRVGYTPGALYQVYDDLHALIFDVHARTLRQFEVHCKKRRLTGDPRTDLRGLAQSYIEFTKANLNRWNAVFEYQRPKDRPWPEEYTDALNDLLALAVDALRPLYGSADKDALLHHARVLFYSMYGIVILDTTNKISPQEHATGLLETLIDVYVEGALPSKR